MYLPIHVNLENKSILIVGGGHVAFHKLKTLVKFTTSIVVVGKTILPELRQFPLAFHERAYGPQDLDGHFLIYACTNDHGLNHAIKREANARGLLVNVADTAGLCDFISPAVHQAGDVVVAVSSHGKNVRAAVAWRDRIKEWMDHGHTGN
jgi:precorrin-2 dehydrogenase/sirohydrochlorin ferrochelatase